MGRLSAILYWKIPFDQGRISSLMYTQHLASSCYKNAWYPSRRKQSKIPRPNPSKPSFPWFHLRSVAGSQLHFHLQTIGLPSFTYIPMLSVMYKPSPEKKWRQDQESAFPFCKLQSRVQSKYGKLVMWYWVKKKNNNNNNKTERSNITAVHGFSLSDSTSNPVLEMAQQLFQGWAFTGL